LKTKFAPPRGRTTELHRAALVGDLAAVTEWLANERAIDPRDPDGYTPFLLACKHTEPDVFHALLNAGADIEATNAQGMSGLFLVATTGVVSLARVLIDRGASVNRPAARGLTPLMAGIMSENPDMVRLLIAAGADVTDRDSSGKSVRQWARKHGGPEIVDLIRNPDRPASRARKLRASDLHRAATTGDVERIRECVAAGVAVDAIDDDGFTPLMLAARQHKRAAIAALLSAGANAFQAHANGATPLLLAASSPIALRPFVAANLNLNHANRDGLTPLMSAARQGVVAVVRFLIDSGANIRARDADDRTALDHAVFYGHRKIAQMLRSAVIG
jgi:ankyrin repeat protein